MRPARHVFTEAFVKQLGKSSAQATVTTIMLFILVLADGAIR
jgi:hypothetical protein